MINLPVVIENNEESVTILSRNWKKRSVESFVLLINELVLILERLGQIKSHMAKKVYSVITEIVKMVGPGDKRDYLVEQFLPIISKFPKIPIEYFISSLKNTHLSHS